MKNNLKTIIDDHYQEIEKRIQLSSRLDWHHVDENFYELDGGKIFLKFFDPTILNHQDDQGEPGRYIWYRLVVSSDDFSEEALETILRQILEIIGLRPFMDEDAGGKFFVEKDRNFRAKVYCYINPDFPKGWWENHTLPPKE